MSERNLLTWDGEQFLERPESEARDMAKADTAQVYDPDNGWDGDLKVRAQFTGYHNKAMATKVDNTVEEKPKRVVRRKKVARKKKVVSDEDN